MSEDGWLKKTETGPDSVKTHISLIDLDFSDSYSDPMLSGDTLHCSSTHNMPCFDISIHLLVNQTHLFGWRASCVPLLYLCVSICGCPTYVNFMYVFIELHTGLSLSRTFVLYFLQMMMTEVWSVREHLNSSVWGLSLRGALGIARGSFGSRYGETRVIFAQPAQTPSDSYHFCGF